MKQLALVILVAGLISGCQKAPTAEPAPGVAQQPAAQQPAPAAGGSGGVNPIGPPVGGPIQPMSGSDSVEGAGAGGVGNAAKDAARGAAAKGGGSSVDQAAGSGE